MSTTGGRGGQQSAGCRVRCIHLILLLECLLFSIGTSASHSRKEIGDSAVTIDNSLTAAEKLHNSLNFYPALQESEVHFSQKDSLFPAVSLDSHSRPGLLSLLRRFVAKFCSSAVLDSRPVEKMILTVGSNEDSKFTSSTSSGNRRLGPPEHSKRRSPCGRSLWALDQRQQVHNEGHRVLSEETVSSPGVPQKQVVHLGPPAPADLLNNEKQDWNQDYAEPDVHPPSSN